MGFRESAVLYLGLESIGFRLRIRSPNESYLNSVLQIVFDAFKNPSSLMEIAGLLNGGFQPQRYRPGGIGNWSGHLPFAHDLTVAVRPSLLVELGTHYGESYFGFCQAVRENDIGCCCYAVDTWLGEPHAGFYDEGVYNDVNAYNSSHYSDFSYLLRTTFDEAIAKFTDESVDILHIDGLHTYQAVSHDLRLWLKKVKPGGIILLHDVMVRHADFGVWKVWEELESDGTHFSFRHDWGLGVFRKNGSAVPDNEFFKLLFDSSLETREHVRKFYALCATKLAHEHDNQHRHWAPEGGLVAHVYPFGVAGYSADASIAVDLTPGRWEHLLVDLVQGVGNGPLRIDPAEQAGLIDVSGVVLRRPADGEVMWSAKGADELAALTVGGTLVRVSEAETTDFCRFFSHGSDPQLIITTLDSKRFDQPLLLEIWLRVQTDMASLLPVLQAADEQRSRIHTLESDLQELRIVRTDKDRATEEMRNARLEAQKRLEERNLALQERNLALQERDAAEEKRHEALKEVSAATQEGTAISRQHELLLAAFRKLQSDLYVTKTDLKRKTAEEERIRSELSATQSVLNDALTSRSWRITAPVRTLSERLRGKR